MRQRRVTLSLLLTMGVASVGCGAKHEQVAATTEAPGTTEPMAREDSAVNPVAPSLPRTSDAGAEEPQPSPAPSMEAPSPPDQIVPAVQGVFLVESGDTLGRGDCAGISVAAVAALVAEQRSDLANITLEPHPPLGQPLPSASGEAYYLAQISAEGMQLAFRRCLGEVVSAECTHVAYDFFATDAACLPVATGSYEVTRSEEGCYDTTGDVVGSFSGFAIPEHARCDFDPMPQLVGGSFYMSGVGIGSFCGQTFEVPVFMDVEIDQNAADPSLAVVTISNSGFACVDGVPFPARVILSAVEGELLLPDTNPPSEKALCAPPARLFFYYDAEVAAPEFPGKLEYDSLDGDGCGDDGASYSNQGNMLLSALRE